MTATKENLKKLLRNEPLVSFLLFIFGVVLFSLIVESKKIHGGLALVFLGGAYLAIGVGLYGMIKIIILTILKFIKNIIKLFSAGKIEVTIRI